MNKTNANGHRPTPVRDRRTAVVFVSRPSDIGELERLQTTSWTLPSNVRPGDRLVVYKPGPGRGWAGPEVTRPSGVYLATAVVYGVPERRRDRRYHADIGEVAMFYQVVPRKVVAEAFPEWSWLRVMRGSSGVVVPAALEEDFWPFLRRSGFAGRSER